MLSNALDSDGVRFMQIFAGVPWKVGVIQQWGNRKRVLSRFQRYIFGTLGNGANIIIQHYLVPCRLSTDPKIRDLEWLWMARRAILRYMFTITSGHWPIICYLFTVVCLLHVIWPAEKCEKRSIAYGDPQSGRIFGSRGKFADLPWTLYRRNSEP